VPTPGPLEFTVAVRDVDRNLLPPDARRVGSERFEQEIITYYQRQFAAVGGTVHLDMDDENIHVEWRPDKASEDPFEYALTLLRRGELEQAIPLMESLLAANPGDPNILYNLAMAYSDRGRVDEAIELLSRAVDADPENANILVALGAARQRNGEPSEALEVLRDAVALDPANSYAHRNLGGILAGLGGFREAEPYLREAVRLAPEDQQAIYGLAATLERLGGNEHLGEADDLYQRAIDIDPSTQVAETARQARSKMAQESFRRAGTGTPRMDAVMYCLDALEKFDQMTPEQVKAVTLEIALLGRQGLDANDSTPKYNLRSLPGDFSGLHLVSLMYVGLKQMAPDQDMGFDLSTEYETAQQLFSKKKG
jgi:Tfp pilus assembly protein PilF